MLDNREKIKELDKGNMFELIYEFPRHCQDAMVITRESICGLRLNNIFNVVITGMGGSAIGGDLIRMLATDSAQIPIVVNRDYTLPAFVDERTLVIASSYSGNTEETLAAYEDAKRKKAKIIAITTGGQLKEKAMADEVPCITIPGGLPPRGALGYSFFSTYILFKELGIGFGKQDINMALDLLNETRDQLKVEVPEKGQSREKTCQKNSRQGSSNLRLIKPDRYCCS